VDATEFWRWIDQSVQASEGSKDRQIAALTTKLEGVTRDEVVAFNERLCEALREANHWSVLVAARIIGCGDSDDGFLDFRAWLVSRGEVVFRSTLADPDTLAGIPVEEDPIEEWTFEDLRWLPEFVSGEEAGISLAISRGGTAPEEFAGDPCEEDAASLRGRAPRLWARFGESRGRRGESGRWRDGIRKYEAQFRRYGNRAVLLLGASVGAFGYTFVTWSFHSGVFHAIGSIAGMILLTVGCLDLRRSWKAWGRAEAARAILA
jgi:hypothetical protein